MKQLKSVFLILLTILGSWLIMGSGERLLDNWFVLDDLTKFAIGVGLVIFGVIKLR